MIFGFVQDFPYLCAASNVFSDPFFTRKTPISENNSLMTPFLLCSHFRTHPTNSTSQNIGGTDAWAVPTSNFWGPSPQAPPTSPPMPPFIYLPPFLSPPTFRSVPPSRNLSSSFPLSLRSLPPVNSLAPTFSSLPHYAPSPLPVTSLPPSVSAPHTSLSPSLFSPSRSSAK